jgi:hypothetical protein
MNCFELCRQIEIMCEVSGWKVLYDESNQIRLRHNLYQKLCCPIEAFHLYQTGEIPYASGGAIYSVAEVLDIPRKDAEQFIRAMDVLGGCVYFLTGTESQLHMQVSNLIQEA